MVGTSAIVCRRARQSASARLSAGKVRMIRGLCVDREKRPVMALARKHTLRAFVVRRVVND
jgi:hypothetical protein